MQKDDLLQGHGSEEEQDSGTESPDLIHEEKNRESLLFKEPHHAHKLHMVPAEEEPETCK